MGQSILECAARGVVGLSAVAEDAGKGAQQDEEVNIRERVAEVLASLDFGQSASSPVVVRHVGEECVPQNRRALEDAADGTEFSLALGQSGGQRDSIRHIAGNHPSLGALFSELVEKVPCLGGCSSRARQEAQVPSSKGNEHSRNTSPKAAHTADQEEHAVFKTQWGYG